MGKGITVFAAWGTWVARHRWPVFAVTLAAVIVAGVWGVGVFGQLTEGGYNDPNSESTRAATVVQEALGAQGGDVVVIYTPAQGSIDDAVLAQRVENRLAGLPRDAVTATTSYWRDQAPQYVSQDRRSAVAVLTLAGDGDAEKLASYREIDDRLEVEGASHRVAGGTVLADATSTLSTQDLAVAEAVSLPIVLVLLLLIFGSLVAAALPVLVGGAAVLGSLGVLHGIAYSHDVNSFAVNVASLLGLGMAIDYGLFMVGRFREEQAYGRTPAEAVTRTVATAGRTVVFSATLLMIALAGLMLFPQGFLKSLAYGGLAAVALAAFLSLTLLPAVLVILGPRVDKLPIRLPKRRNAPPAGTGWARLADIVLHRPLLVALPLIAGLLILAAPIRGVTFGEADERVLPAAEPARQAIEALKRDFPALSSAGVQVVLRGPAAAGGSAAFAEAVAKVPGIAAVTPAGAKGEVVALTATLRDQDPFSAPARDAVADIRALPPPPGTELLVGGTTARNVDSLEATADRLPLMIGLLVGATLLLMFLAFGSVLLPIKAVVVSAISLAATFGVLVWIFQDGHGAGLLNITPAPPEVGIVVLMAAVVFGLSTDYEVFLLSRMVEARTRGATTAEAVTTGLARTGRVISAAALLLIVVTGAFALSSVTTMRFVGIGMIIALVLDATVVRMVLVPAILSLLGDAAWWAPGPLRRLQERAGLAEYAGEELFPTVSVGRHAAPESAEPRTSSGSGSRPRHASQEPAGVPGWATGAVRELPPAVPVSAVPVSPASAKPVSTTPASAPPVSPPPSSEVPASEVPASETAASATAPSETAASDVPASDSPASDSPASGLPASGLPASGAPEVPVSPGAETPVSPPSGLPASVPVPVSGAPAPSGLPKSPPVSGAPAGPAADDEAGSEPTVAATPSPEREPATGSEDEVTTGPDSDSDPDTGSVPDQGAASAGPPARNENRVPAGERATVRIPTGEQRPVRIPTGEQQPVRAPTGEQQPIRTPTGEQPIRTPTGEQPIRTPTGEQQPIRTPTGEQPIGTPTGEQPIRTPTGEQKTVRTPTGEQQPVGTPTGGQQPVRTPTGEQNPVRTPTGEQKPARTPDGEQKAVRAPAAEPPATSGDQPAEPAPDATPAEDPDALETVDLSSRMTRKPEADDPAPDTTAVLEMGPTVDLSSRLEQEAERRA